MSMITSHISHEMAKQYGQEAVRIIHEGGYRTPSGEWADLSAALQRSVSATVAHPPETPAPGLCRGSHPTQVEVVNETTLSAAVRLLHAGCNPVVLNFASPTHPGGGFLEGARAQEEYLARSSGLYASLKDQPMYAYHRRNSDAMASSYMLYSPEVPVFRGDDGGLLETPYTVGIITAAAPIAKHLPPERNAEIEAAFADRIARVLWAGLHHGHDAIVLGAWGCGAFGNDGRMVSRVFHAALNGNFTGAYQRVIFAILDWSDERRFIGPFEKTFMNS